MTAIASGRFVWAQDGSVGRWPDDPSAQAAMLQRVIGSPSSIRSSPGVGNPATTQGLAELLVANAQALSPDSFDSMARLVSSMLLMRGDYHSLLFWAEHAAEYAQAETAAFLLVRAAGAAFEMGNGEPARGLLSRADEVWPQRSAEALWLHGGDFPAVDAAQVVVGIPPADLYRAYVAAKQAGDNEQAMAVAGVLAVRYPDGPEAALVASNRASEQERVFVSPRLSVLIPLGRETDVGSHGLQVGAFDKLSNALNAVEQLRFLGYVVSVRFDDRTHRYQVIVSGLGGQNAITDPETLRASLRSQGFVGFSVPDQRR